MAELFKASDVAAAAVTMEKRGQEMYRRLAAGSKEPEAKRFFEFFAGEEARHEELFRQLQSRLGAIELPAWSTQEEFSQYLSALMDSYALFSAQAFEDMNKRQPDGPEAVRLAMGFERDAILFFMEMRELVPDQEKKFVQQCVEEERRHIRQLAQMLAQMLH